MKVKGILDLLSTKYNTKIDIFYITVDGIDISMWHNEWGYIYDAEINNDCIVGFFSDQEYLVINLQDEIYTQREYKLKQILK
jgi:hypothetical protein